MRSQPQLTVVERVAASSNVTVIADDSLRAGGCIVETDRSRVDATLETQIAELSSLLLDETPTVRQTGSAGTDSDANGESDIHGD